MSSNQEKALVINKAIFEEATFRANQNYELVLFDRLPPAQQEMLADLQKQPNFYGILRPVESSGLSIKSVSHDTALLYLTLREPARLPAYARIMGGENYEAVVAKLVLDQILEIEESGEFVSGARAYDLLYGEGIEAEARNRIGQLSISALRYGQALAVSDILELSMRLYNYHRLPVSSRWQQKFPTPEKVAELLGVDARGRNQHLLAEYWRPVTRPGSSAGAPDGTGEPETATEIAASTEAAVPVRAATPGADESSVGWLAWSARHGRVALERDGSIFKLYISPLPDFIQKAFDVTLKTLAHTRAFHFKVGADLDGMLRPDKMVAYFPSLEDLQAAAKLLAEKLEGCPAHGVPFTAEIAGDGLLSWGVDPPDSEQLLSWQPQESWRLWLTNRLANALVGAKNGSRTNGAGRLEPWQYALRRLRVEGVDTELWAPARQLWRKAGSPAVEK